MKSHESITDVADVAAQARAIAASKTPLALADANEERALPAVTSEPSAASTTTDLGPALEVGAWAKAKSVDAFFLAGALGMKRAAREWDLYSEPVVTEAEFDAAVAAFTNISIG